MKTRKPTSIFIVDDDRTLSYALQNGIESTFARFDVSVKAFDSGEQCREQINSRPDIAIIDYHLDGRGKKTMDGIRIVDLFKKHSPDTEIIMFTGEENAEIAVKAMHHGVHDYVVKNDHVFRKVNMAIFQCMRLKELKQSLRRQRIIGFASLILVTLLVGISIALKVSNPGIF